MSPIPGSRLRGRRNRSRLVRGGVCVALGLLASASRAHAWCRTTTDQSIIAPTTCVTTGAPLYWSRRCQTFSLDASGGVGIDIPTLRSVATAAFGAWNGVQCGGIPVFQVVEGGGVTCQDAEYRSDDGNANVIAFVNDFAARMYPTDAVAVTIVWHNTETGQIYDADMLLNEGFGPFEVCPSLGCPPGTTGFDLQNVITHEAGHFLGLAHSADVVSTMFFRAQTAETSKRTLSPDDIDGFCAAYGGSGVPAACDPTPRHGFDPDCTVEPPPATPDGGCGCVAAGSARARPSSLAALLLAGVLARLARTRRGRAPA